MIAYVRGMLAEKSPSRVVVEAAGIGYEIFIPVSTYEALPHEGDEVKLLVFHSVRDDDETLYGFAGGREKDMFEKLLSVSGVGPKLALAVLSGITVQELSSAIASGNSKRISSVRGLGRKTAEKICIELKDKIDKFAAFEGEGSSSSPAKEFMRDAAMALCALGFNEETALKMVGAAMAAHPEISDTETLVKTSLLGGK